MSATVLNSRPAGYPPIVSSPIGGGSRFVIWVAWLVLATVARLRVHAAPATTIFEGLRMVQLMAVSMCTPCTLRAHTGELLDLTDRDEVAFAHDADAVADVLDLR